MSTYVKASVEQISQLFKDCNDKKLAGSNTNQKLDKDYSLVYEYTWDLISHKSSPTNNADFWVTITIPLYAPAISMVFNAVNQKLEIKELELSSFVTRQEKAMTEYKFKKGRVTNVHCHKQAVVNKEGKVFGSSLNIQSLAISFEFEKVSFNDNVSNTSGNVSMPLGDN